MNARMLRAHLGGFLIALTFAIPARSGQNIETMTEEQIKKVGLQEIEWVISGHFKSLGACK